jgi:glycosyltransferase involved in cell wall biosynthesis
LNRVVLATTATSPGGVWRHIVDLGVGLRDKDWDVSVWLAPSNTALRRRAAELGFGLADDARRSAGSIWHFHLADTYDRRVPGMMISARQAGAVCILTEHLPRTNASDPTLAPGGRKLGATQAKTAFKWIEGQLAHHVIAVSAGSRRFLLDRYGLAPSRVAIVENGVAPAERTPLRTRHDPMRVLAIGALIVQKGHEVLIRALANRKHDWSVAIAGEGPARQRLEETARASGLDNVEFLGWRSDVARLIEDADVVCMPSLWEAFPYAALEGMQAGRAIVGTKVDGLEDIVVDGKTGLLVHPGDPPGLAHALDQLANDRDQRLTMGSRGRQRVLDRYSVKRMIDGTEAVYERAASWSR